MHSSKVGIGIITCNREDFYTECMNSVVKIPELDHIITINDGAPYPHVIYDLEDQDHKLIVNDKNIGVGESKNKALQYLLDKGCDHIFLIEDDIIVKDPSVVKQYINYRNETGIQHFLFGYHGPANRGNISSGEPTPKAIIDYNGDIKVALNEHCVGAFCYYSRESLLDVGLIDPEFVNAFDHVEHSYRLCNKGYCPGYWWWPDIWNSYELLDEQACSEVSSAIRPRKDWQDNLIKGWQTFIDKHGVSPTEVPNVPVEHITKRLKYFKSKS